MNFLVKDEKQLLTLTNFYYNIPSINTTNYDDMYILYICKMVIIKKKTTIKTTSIQNMYIYMTRGLVINNKNDYT